MRRVSSTGAAIVKHRSKNRILIFCATCHQKILFIRPYVQIVLSYALCDAKKPSQIDVRRHEENDGNIMVSAMKSKSILLAALYSWSGIRWSAAFVPQFVVQRRQTSCRRIGGGSSVLFMTDTAEDIKTRAVEEAIKVTEMYGIDSREAATAWGYVNEISNMDYHSSMQEDTAESDWHAETTASHDDAAPQRYFVPTPPSEEPPIAVVAPSAAVDTTMSDLAREWEARNRGEDVAVSAPPLSFPSVEPVPPTATTASIVDETDKVNVSFEEVSVQEDEYTYGEDDDDDYIVDKIASVDKELWFDPDTGRFYESSYATSVSLKADDMEPQISMPKRFPHMEGRGWKDLQKQLQDRNTLKEGEDKYAVADRELYDQWQREASEMNEAAMAAVKELSMDQELTEAEKLELAAKIEKATKPRPYGLFLVEKAAEFVETSVKGLSPFKGKSSPIPKAGRKRIVVLGSGWGAASFLKGIDSDLFDVTVISPRNHFVFTPMLAGASVGTVEYRSITEPIREINRQARFLEATATDIDPKTQLVTCQSVICDGNSCDICEFTVSYDRLVVTVGAQTNTFGIPGVREYCCFLKQVEDARRIRTAIVNCFERANLPGLTEEERMHDLTFAVIGAGRCCYLVVVLIRYRHHIHSCHVHATSQAPPELNSLPSFETLWNKMDQSTIATW